MSAFWQEVGGWARAHSRTSLCLSTSSSDEAVSCNILSDGIRHRYYALFTALSVGFLFTYHRLSSSPQHQKTKHSLLQDMKNTASPTAPLEKKSYLMLAVRSKPPSESFNGKNLNIKPLNNYTHLCQSTWKFKFWIFSITSFIVERRWLQVVWNSSSLFVNSGYDGSKIPSVHQFLWKLRQRGANLLQMTSSFCQPDNAWRCEQGVTL